MKEFDMTNSKQQETGMSRRDFVGALGIGLGSACILNSINAEEVSAASGKRVILYDSSKCVGCHYCEAGCKNFNNLTGEVTLDLNALPKDLIPLDMLDDIEIVEAVTQDDRDANRWLRVIKKNINLEDGTTKDVFVRHSCTHCGLCAQVCPSKALTQREDGIVIMEPSKCIGCHYCYQACPFDIPRYRTDGEDKAMQKCIMCSERVDEGKEPACVQVCPVDALTFGYVEDRVEAGHEAVSNLIGKGYSDAYLYGEKELGSTGLMYILPYSFDKYDLPKLPLEDQTPITWEDFVAPVGWGAGIVAIAALAFTGIK
jgi:formate dehydrogenase iron-sulfur subunit